jgi:hypothetical protein
MLHLYNLIFIITLYVTMQQSVYVFHHCFSYCSLSGNVLTESLLRNRFGYPYYNMYMFYLVHNIPLSSQYVLFIYSTKVKLLFSFSPASNDK